MRRVSYLRLAAWLPLMPLAAFPRLYHDKDPGGVLGVLFFAAAIGGIPYAASAAVSLYLLREKPPDAYWRLARWAPPIFALVFGACSVVFGIAADRSSSLGDMWVYPVAAGFYALYIVPIGYGYVLLAWLGYRALERAGAFRDAA